MKAVILAAGRGNRLGTLTSDRPKCMLEFGEESILERQIRILKQYGIKDISVVVGYKKERVVEHIQGVTFIENDKFNITDNSYSLFLALENIDDEVVVLDGDLVFEEDTIQELVKNKGTVLLATKENAGYGMTGILLGDAGEVKGIGKHILTNLTYASIMKLSAEMVSALRKELKKPEASKTWYTIPLNKTLPLVKTVVCVTNAKILGINTYFDLIEAKKKFNVEDFSILVTGASGFLGQKIYYILKRDFNVEGIRGTTSNGSFIAVDLTDIKSLDAYLELTKPKIIIHTAGIPEPEKCSENQSKAYTVNVEAVGNLVDACKKRNIKLIHISTDYVFDGLKEEEYSHNDARKPCNYYGETKKQAEDLVKEYENSLIVRIPIIYGYNNERDKTTFPVQIINKLQKNETVYLDNQQIRYPVLIDTVAIAVRKALGQTGIIHVTSAVPVTKYKWAKIIADEFNLDSKLICEKPFKELINRPPHVKLKVEEKDFNVLDIYEGTKVLRKQMNCAFRLIYKGQANEVIYGKNIGQYRYDLGKKLGESLPNSVVEELDYVMPVPMSGLYYAMGMAEAIGIPYLQGLVKPDTSTRSFQIADFALRERTIRGKIHPIEAMIRNKTIALVDEAIFTGTTLRCVCDMVKACGAKKIYICIPTPLSETPCRQFVQPERKLLSHYIASDEIKNYFRVEEVFFQPLSNFKESIRGNDDICYECLGQLEGVGLKSRY